jgi:hypothetical protein
VLGGCSQPQCADVEPGVGCHRPDLEQGEKDVVNTTAARLRATLERIIIEESLALTRGIAGNRPAMNVLTRYRRP